MEATLANRGKLWRFWCAYCKPLGIDPYLEKVNFQTKTRVATGSVGLVLKGSHGHEKQVQVVTVLAELVGVKANIALDTGQQPLHQPGANDKYILPLQHMLKTFENKDPPRINKLAFHPDLLDWLCKWGHSKGSSPQHQVMGDL